MAARDLDAILLNIDWSLNDWRDFDWREVEPQLHTLRDETVHTLAQAHHRQRPGDLSPIHMEQFNRLQLHSDSDPGTPSGKPIWQYFVAEEAVDNDTTFTDHYGEPPPEAEFEGRKVRNMFTASVVLEYAIAAMLASGVKYDPHPADRRTLLTDPTDRHKYDTGLLNDIRDDVVRLLNGAGVRAIAKHPDEASSAYQADVRRATIAEYGVDPVDPSGSPTRPRYSKVTEDEAQRYYQATLSGTLELRAAAYTWEMLKRRCDWVRADLQKRGVFDPRSIRDISERHDALLKLSWFKAKRDLFHIYIPGMQPRYRAWSVAQWKQKASNVVQIPWYGISRKDYNPQVFGTDGAIPFPEEHYRWFYGRIYSPVMPIDLPNSIRMRDRFEWVCRALRTKYRIHKDMGMLELGTTVNIGHTLGFTLLDLKKIVTAWVLVEGTMAKLHRHHRFHHGNRGGFGAAYAGGVSITDYTRLGAACHYAEDPNGAPYFSAAGVFPAVSRGTWDHLIQDMCYWVSPAWFWNLDRPAQMFIHAVWAHTDITSLARALEPRWPNTQVSLRVRCRGERRTGLPTEDDNGNDNSGGAGPSAAAAAAGTAAAAAAASGSRIPQTIEFAGMQQSIDGVHIAMWTTVCAAYVHFCTQAGNRDAYFGLFSDCDQLLRRLGLPDEVIEHFAKGFVRGNNEYWEPEDPDDIHVNWDDPFYPPYIRPQPEGGQGS
ncbi:hypothetical protein SLS62_001411 [Diatrype stigma]|uniref:Uncharacterized protein n=1 Tax=Diatrype stigma TaxID=117547 RepID=A0AAN9YW38_9PEZI